MAGKLSGREYLDYWRRRIAKGPEQVGRGGSSPEEVERQGDYYWSMILREIKIHSPSFTPNLVVEIGSGWGRLLRRMRATWPEAELRGVELCEKAVEESWWDERTSISVGAKIPALAKKADLVVSCTVLQHITDPVYLEEAVRSMEDAVSPDGLIVILENVEISHAEHLLGIGREGYKALFTRTKLLDESNTISYHGEHHAVMVGRRA